MTGYQWARRPQISGLSWDKVETDQTRPLCASVPVSLRGAWTSEDADARAWAREGCAGCPIRIRCLTDAISSGVKTGVYAGHDLSNPYERDRAKQWLKAQEHAS